MRARAPQPRAGRGSRRGGWGPLGGPRPRACPARAGATPAHHDRPTCSRPHQVSGARRVAARVLPTPPLQHRPQAPHPWFVPLPTPPTACPLTWRGTLATGTPVTLCPLQRAEAAGRGRLCGSRVKTPSPRKLTSTESRRWGPACRSWTGWAPRGADLQQPRLPTVAIACRLPAVQPACLPSLQLQGPPCVQAA